MGEIFDQMFAVGVGEDLNKNILSMLSKEDPIHVSDFSALDQVIEQMTSKICNEIHHHILANEEHAEAVVPATTTPAPPMTEAPVDEEEVVPPTDDDDEESYESSGSYYINT